MTMKEDYQSFLVSARNVDEYTLREAFEAGYLAGQASAEQQITELKYLLSRVLEASVPYYDDGTPIINDELSDRLNKVLP